MSVEGPVTFCTFGFRFTFGGIGAFNRALKGAGEISGQVDRLEATALCWNRSLASRHHASPEGRAPGKQRETIRLRIFVHRCIN